MYLLVKVEMNHNLKNLFSITFIINLKKIQKFILEMSFLSEELEICVPNEFIFKSNDLLVDIETKSCAEFSKISLCIGFN